MGTSYWEYPQLAADECLITTDFLADYPSLAIGDKVAFGANYNGLWKNMGNFWNQNIRLDNQTKFNSKYIDTEDPSIVECRIKGFLPDGEIGV